MISPKPKVKGSPVEVTIKFTGRNLPRMLDRIKNPHGEELEQLSAQSEALRAQVTDEMNRRLLAEDRLRETTTTIGVAAGRVTELQDRLRVGLLQVERCLSSPELNLLKGYLDGSMRPPSWTHLCSKNDDKRVTLTKLEDCAACGHKAVTT